MSKKERNIKLELTDAKRDGIDVAVLQIGKHEIGYVKPEGERFDAYLAGNETPLHAKTQDDAINELIMQYHLHNH
ncbi:hypothetical protein IV38_GL000202 [Lactobacillus selangorensis]|uniref:DUF2969 domain-containing protein n=1 Tax=Lactobacillus selangorensis TaxID=81857 RepID=A0A0R2G0W4_9LACO|nr:DUF2969 domain-containing protein [Lactobacillus selangorensis]KRN29319.1 hypothetical protein IV38_GL000202 [Lactobacillus selangorensis]KRN34152.1 hypothetical protein IV40_GL000467 [Lactobacillus selangorensis]